jgi:hypothetical protein
MASSVRLVWAIGATERSVIRLALGGSRGLTGLGAYWTVLNRTRRCRARCALRGDPTAAPTARCRTASTRQAARRRSSEVRAAAHGGARGRACPVRHRVARPSRQVQPAHASCVGPPWSAGALLPVGKAMPWEPAPASLGYPFGGTRIRAGLSSRGAVPDPQAEGDARRPAGGGDQSGGPPGAKRFPGCTGKPGARPPARRGYPNNFQANRPDPRAEGLPGPIPRRSPATPPQPWRNGRWW